MLSGTQWNLFDTSYLYNQEPLTVANVVTVATVVTGTNVCVHTLSTEHRPWNFQLQPSDTDTAPGHIWDTL